MNDKKDWKQWHDLYDNEESILANRLKLVRQLIADCLTSSVKGSYTVIDICAGDGRDLLDVLADYPDASKVHSYLVEIDPQLASKAQQTVESNNIPQVKIVNDDASYLAIYESVAPADLILLCGVFGNVGQQDVQTIITSLAQVSQRGTRVIWTRNLRTPGIVSEIRNLFVANEFQELALQTTRDNSYAVGLYEFHGSPQPLNPETKLFTFFR